MRRGLVMTSCSARITGVRGDFHTAVVDSDVIHGIEISALSAPRCRPPLFFSYFDHCN